MESPMDVSPCLATTRSHSIGRKIDRPGCVEGLCADNNKKRRKREKEAAHAGAAEAALDSAAVSAPAGTGASVSARWRRRQVTGEAGFGQRFTCGILGQVMQ
ncbi:hypothetical protein Adt_16857 [Abeliophyllum distichum]|uniref:Uncharacterized protein n=1 Tax=Abeliophyllum distichum TaxID=126358 RepID=A0ABD1TEV3_9LAMI